jgi:hypothetical protein
VAVLRCGGVSAAASKAEEDIFVGEAIVVATTTFGPSIPLTGVIVAKVAPCSCIGGDEGCGCDNNDNGGD